MTKRRVHYVLSTHWDREWHQPFQDVRYRLVELIDKILAGFADGRLKGPFQTDGQAVLIEDYLEVRPDRREQIEKAAQKGKLIIGPWYALPDEFTVSGESLIRNLEAGRAVARSLGGKPSGAGFLCDMFGHNSQMPQIFAGFGIRGGFIWRGLNIDKRNIIWRGADGTELPCYVFGPAGYANYATFVRHWNDFKRKFNPVEGANDLETNMGDEARNTDVNPVLLFDGCDHQEWDQEMYGVLLDRMKRKQGPYQLVHTSLDEYLREMLEQADKIETVYEGELRDPRRKLWGGADVIAGVLSSRVWIKQDNTECQNLLCHWAEPFSAFASAALNQEYPQGFLNVAWRWLLQNHSHDSIGSCSLDQVHEDMKYRFDQCRRIADRLTIEATHKLAASIEGDVTDSDLRVVVFNPLVRDFDQVTEMTLQIPTEWPVFNEFFGYEPKPAFRIYGADGSEIPYQRLAQAMGRMKVRVWKRKLPEGYKTNDVKVALRLSVPASGYTTLSIRAGEESVPTRYPEMPGLVTSECGMGNEQLAVSIESNGTLTITDKRSDQVYNRLLTFEDAADIGDGWNRGVAVNDQVFVSTACKSEIALIHHGPMLATFRIRTTMLVPDGFHFDSMRRSDQFTELLIDSLVSLRPGQDYVQVQTTVDNCADDHRLRVLLPTGADAQTYLADSPFDVVERPIALREDNYKYHELEVETKPQQSWTAVSDEKRGLAVVSAGLLESAVCDIPDRSIALTLFRGMRRTIFTDGEPGGQVRGPMTFDYRIVPVTGQPDRTRLCELGREISAGVRIAQLRPQDLAAYRTGHTLPPTAGFLRVDGPVIVSSVRQVGEGLELRMFNPWEKMIVATVDVTHRPKGTNRPSKLQRVDFESNPLDEPATFDGTAKVKLNPKQIVTLRLT